MNEETTIKAVLAAAGSAIVAYFHIMVIPLIILLVVMIADYVSGMTKAWMNAELSSRVGIKGIVKKCCYRRPLGRGTGHREIILLRDPGDGVADNQ